MAMEVTILASTARAKSMTAFQRSRLSTVLKPPGGVAGVSSLSAKYVLLAQVPLTRREAGATAAASVRSRGFCRSIAARYAKRSEFAGLGAPRPDRAEAPAP